ncbi:MAG TPA: NIF family HAD-type phosphatase, partial [Bacillota bacterium]|nr:NIF family HAD-type phosphatase [Bacillota bacterium]HEX3047425.1 NIF family HAD-type phosphatase [Bacillota bacterium]
MNIVMDMDNTLTDEFGSSVRPGIINFLETLKRDGHVLILWTNSTKERAVTILKDHRLHFYFSRFIFREDYDPQNIGLPKDIRKVEGDLLIDDDPDEI